MFKGLRDLVELFFDGDGPTPTHVRVTRTLFRVLGVLFVAWAAGLFEPWTSGFARADEVDKKIAATIVPLQKQVADIANVQTQQSEVLKQIRIDQLGQKLRDLHRACCAVPRSDQALKERMKVEIEYTQREYRALAGERYPMPEDCIE